MSESAIPAGQESLALPVSGTRLQGWRLLRERLLAVTLVVMLGVGVGTGWQYLLQKERELDEKILALQLEKEELLRENRFLKYIRDLSMEFSMDPLIVALVDQQARQYVREGGKEWRLLRTPEFVTYIMLSLIYAESRGDPQAVGDDGRARGLTQIWVTTAQQYGEVTPEQLLDPEINIAFAFKHFHYLLQKYEGNVALVLYAWNRGSGKVDRLLLYGQSPENGYGRRIYEAALTANRDLLVGN